MIVISVAALLTHILNVVVVCVRPIETRPGSVFSTNAPVYGKLSEILCLSYVRPNYSAKEKILPRDFHKLAISPLLPLAPLALKNVNVRTFNVTVNFRCKWVMIYQ